MWTCWWRRAVGPAPKVDQPLDRAPADVAPAPNDPGFRAIIPAGNLAGLPALVLPCGFADKPAGGAAVGGSAVLGEYAAGSGTGISGADGLAPAPSPGN